MGFPRRKGTGPVLQKVHDLSDTLFGDERAKATSVKTGWAEKDSAGSVAIEATLGDDGG